MDIQTTSAPWWSIVPAALQGIGNILNPQATNDNAYLQGLSIQQQQTTKLLEFGILGLAVILIISILKK